jgi:hypothetical protein
MMLAAARQTGAETATAGCLITLAVANARCARQQTAACNDGPYEAAVVDVALYLVVE